MWRRALTYGLLLVAACGMLLPFAYLACASFKQNDDLFSSTFLPSGHGFLGVAWDRLSLIHYRELLDQLSFARNLLNSVFFASVISVLATLCCSMSGYALARFRFKGRRLLLNIVIFTLIVPNALLLAPAYQMLFRLHLLNTVYAMILPALAPPFGVFLFRQAVLAGVPVDLLEAARMDGCGEFAIFWKIVLPLVRPMVGAFLLITFLWTWNNFLTPQTVLQSSSQLPLSVAIAQLKNNYWQDYGLLMAGTVLSIIPVLLLFLLLQRDFISGLTSGAVKG